MSEATVIHGDCIEVMRTMDEKSVDSIVTDPPYGLGFMGKKWDGLPPGREWAEECLRVLKPGGHLLAFGGTRTWHRLATSIEDAGFEMRDSIAWLYGSGFPKHRAALKPAFEPIVMARKPFKGSLTANEALHGTGALDIDGCRIGTTVETWPKSRMYGGNPSEVAFTKTRSAAISAQATGPVPSGRWPANVILDEGMAEVLDEQSGVLKSGDLKPYINKSRAEFTTNHSLTREVERLGDSGGASRFFYVAKAPKKERPIVDGVAHPTVKPLTLMRHLVKLVTPVGGVVLEPFAGSGATVEACLLEGFGVIAIERESEYIPLIEARIERTTAA